MKYATRINSYLNEGFSLEESIKEISSINDIEYVDLNYPEHFQNTSVDRIKKCLKENDIKINAINLRFRDEFINGDLGNQNKNIMEKARKLSFEAIEIAEKIDASQIIFWLGHDGYDYSFQLNYTKTWEQIVEILQEVSRSTDKKVSIEYKPYEERATALIDSFGTAMLLVNDVNEENFGVTADYCHMLMKRENPAFVISMLTEKNLLFNMHINDGYGNFDDGLMVGTVSFWQTIETFFYLKKNKFEGVIYFDTFPERERAIEETKFNIRMCKFIEKLIDDYGIENIEKNINENDAIIVNNMLIDILEKN